ncbi:MAG: VOC family protein [Leptospiraceae bacterium]|nr:VOC family protein [Leptospiraceae bacterium]
MNIEISFNVIVTKKLRESVDFYASLFGFEIVADVAWYVHLKHPNGAEIAFLEPEHPTQPPIYQREWSGTGLILSFQVADAKAEYEKIKTRKIPIVFDYKQEDWGQIHFGILDPNGIPVDIVQQVHVNHE